MKWGKENLCENVRLAKITTTATVLTGTLAL